MADFFAKGKNPINGYGGGNLASKSDLTNVFQTGSTATQAISAGTYFYLDGTLVRAKTDIASGATFTENTNYETLQKGALGYTAKIPNYLGRSALKDFTSSKEYTATQDCLFVFWIIASATLNCAIKINDVTVYDNIYLRHTNTSTFSTTVVISFPLSFPLKKGDVVKVVPTSGFGAPSEIRGYELPFYS